MYKIENHNDYTFNWVFVNMDYLGKTHFVIEYYLLLYRI